MWSLWDIGHSFVRRLEDCVSKSPIPRGMYESPFQPDFGLEGREVRFFGWRPNGMKLGRVKDALEFVSSPLYGSYCMEPPYAVILHVGGNDVDSRDFHMGCFMSTLAAILMRLLEGKIVRIVICSLLQRQTDSPFYETRRVEVNHAIQCMVTGDVRFRPFCYFFQWDDRRFTSHAWCDDGVHFTTWGMVKY